MSPYYYSRNLQSTNVFSSSSSSSSSMPSSSVVTVVRPASDDTSNFMNESSKIDAYGSRSSSSSKSSMRAVGTTNNNNNVQQLTEEQTLEKVLEKTLDLDVNNDNNDNNDNNSNCGRSNDDSSAPSSSQTSESATSTIAPLIENSLEKSLDLHDVYSSTHETNGGIDDDNDIASPSSAPPPIENNASENSSLDLQDVYPSSSYYDDSDHSESLSSHHSNNSNNNAPSSNNIEEFFAMNNSTTRRRRRSIDDSSSENNHNSDDDSVNVVIDSPKLIPSEFAKSMSALHTMEASATHHHHLTPFILAEFSKSGSSLDLKETNEEEEEEYKEEFILSEEILVHSLAWLSMHVPSCVLNDISNPERDDDERDENASEDDDDDEASSEDEPSLSSPSSRIDNGNGNGMMSSRGGRPGMSRGLSSNRGLAKSSRGLSKSNRGLTKNLSNRGLTPDCGGGRPGMGRSGMMREGDGGDDSQKLTLLASRKSQLMRRSRGLKNLMDAVEEDEEEEEEEEDEEEEEEEEEEQEQQRRRSSRFGTWGGFGKKVDNVEEEEEEEEENEEEDDEWNDNNTKTIPTPPPQPQSKFKSPFEVVSERIRKARQFRWTVVDNTNAEAESATMDVDAIQNKPITRASFAGISSQSSARRRRQPRSASMDCTMVFHDNATMGQQQQAEGGNNDEGQIKPTSRRRMSLFGRQSRSASMDMAAPIDETSDDQQQQEPPAGDHSDEQATINVDSDVVQSNNKPKTHVPFGRQPRSASMDCTIQINSYDQQQLPIDNNTPDGEQPTTTFNESDYVKPKSLFPFGGGGRQPRSASMDCTIQHTYNATAATEENNESNSVPHTFIKHQSLRSRFTANFGRQQSNNKDYEAQSTPAIMEHSSSSHETTMNNNDDNTQSNIRSNSFLAAAVQWIPNKMKTDSSISRLITGDAAATDSCSSGHQNDLTMTTAVDNENETKDVVVDKKKFPSLSDDESSALSNSMAGSEPRDLNTISEDALGDHSEHSSDNDDNGIENNKPGSNSSLDVSAIKASLLMPPMTTLVSRRSGGEPMNTSTSFTDLVALGQTYNNSNTTTLENSPKQPSSKRFSSRPTLIKGEQSRSSFALGRSHKHMPSPLYSQRGDALASVLSKPKTKAIRHSTIPKQFPLPTFDRRMSALLFVDISGFTKLSRIMELETFSATINSYFELIINEILNHDGDILKFAGDALFAEWRATSGTSGGKHSLPQGEKTLGKCTADAAFCGAKIVEKCSDYQVMGYNAILNVHCGLGAGELVGLHVEDERNTRREYLFLGDPIDQVAEAEGIAKSGELIASSKSIKLLSEYCRVPPRYLASSTPSLIASHTSCKIALKVNYQTWMSAINMSQRSILSVYDSFGTTYSETDGVSLNKLRNQLSLYVHPVVCEDEFGKDDKKDDSQNDKSNKKRGFAEERYRAEAELRSVYVMFIKPEIDAKITGDDETDARLFVVLDKIMKVVSKELNRYQGHLRQFIVDDKGVVLIASFGLRWSTFPNMIAGKALPATLAIHSKLLSELSIDSRIGATYGKAYCGVVGGVRRHEYALLGPSVNLSARLMCSSENRGVLVDDSVVRGRVTGATTEESSLSTSSSKFSFEKRGCVNAKGYDKPVTIWEVEKADEKCTCVVIEDAGQEDKSVISSLNFQICDNCKNRAGGSNFSTSSVIEERILLRIDMLEQNVRQILQSCTVLEQTFDLADVLRAQTQIKCQEAVAKALETAVDEAILLHVGDDGNDVNGGGDDGMDNVANDDDDRGDSKKRYEFSHDIWRECLSKMMLKERRKRIFRAASTMHINSLNL